MKQACVYSPYWDTLGGGEKYAVAAAIVLRNTGYDTSICWQDKKIIKDLEKRYAFDLKGITINAEGFEVYQQGSIWQRWSYLRDYEVVFYVSDGSFPFLFGKKNILHFQVPFTKASGNMMINVLKKKLLTTVVCNSKFTKKVIDRTYGLSSKVVYPPTTVIKPQKKEKYILSVGRFDNIMHSKRQDVLVKAFERMDLKGWKLVLAGGLLHGENNVQELKKEIGGNGDIQIELNPDWLTLEKLYAQATLYWHAAGYGEDLQIHPERAEHFGISTVEAMSAGAVPIVFNGGGLPEIVTNSIDGYVWQNMDELVDKSRQLIEDDKLRQKVSNAAQDRAKAFSLEAFEREFNKVIG